MKKMEIGKWKLENVAGFTLIEALTAITIFVILITAVGSLFVQIINLQRRALNIQRVDENASFIMETLAKEIRVSKISDANTSCPTAPASTLTITHPVNGSVIYSLSGENLLRNAEILNSSRVKVLAASFCVSGNGVGYQPRVTLWLKLQSGTGNTQSTRVIQTTLSQRRIEF